MFLKFPETINSIAIYNASNVTRELPNALSSCINATIVDNYQCDRDDILYIIICPLGILPNTPMPKYYINWQLENLGGHYNTPYYIKRLTNALYNWDYSHYNISILKEQCGIDAFYVPPGYDHTLSLDPNYIYCDYDKDIDVLFLGWDIPFANRNSIRENCTAAGLIVCFIFGQSVEEMKSLIRRSKICLNISTHEYFPFQKIRLNLLLSNQACVVSEVPLDMDASIEEYQDNGVQIVPYAKVVETCCDLIDNPDVRKELAMKSFNWYSTKHKWSNIVDFNSLLPDLK